MITLACPAKVNLFLAIHGREDTGYHLLETVMARTDQLQDFIHMEPADRLTLDSPDLPVDENNSLLKAIRVLEKATGREIKYALRLEKNIPPGSGLGGASSDAAALMVALNEKENLGLLHLELVELGAQVGMDVPFFISGSPVALCTHYGEGVTGLPNLPPDLEFEIHLTGSFQSTAEAYALWDQRGKPSEKNSQALQNALLHEDAHAVLAALHNDFQTILPLPLAWLPRASEVPLLSGSGGAFAVFRVKDKSK